MEPLAAWGQPINGSAPDFDPFDLDPWAQKQQVGYNCDFVAWFDYVVGGSGVVGINHEYTNPELMFPNYSADHATKRQVDYEIAGPRRFDALGRVQARYPGRWLPAPAP